MPGADSLIDPLENRPLSERAREALLDAIRANKFPDGRLPPEPDLAEQLGVSRTTIRAALQSLSADGIISRRRRRGTFVNRHLLRSSMRLNRLVAFTTLIEQCGHVPSVDPQEHRLAAIDADGAEALGVEIGSDALVVERLLRAGGDPVITVVDVVPVVNLRVAPDAVEAADTTFAFLAAHGVAPVDYATSEFIPRVATADAPRGLGLEAGTPYIELQETHFTREHEPIALSVVCVDDSLVRLSMLRRGV
jgi:GntR family transcriptional regulator